MLIIFLLHTVNQSNNGSEVFRAYVFGCAEQHAKFGSFVYLLRYLCHFIIKVVAVFGLMIAGKIR